MRDTRCTITYRVYAVRHDHCRSLLSLQSNWTTITSINFMNGPLARQSLTPLVCADGTQWKEREEKKEGKKRRKTNARRSIERSATLRFAPLLCTHNSAHSLQPSPRHNALSSPTRTVSRYAIVESPCPPPLPPAHFSLWRRKSRLGEMCRATCTSRSRLAHVTRAYKRTARF